MVDVKVNKTKKHSFHKDARINLCVIKHNANTVITLSFLKMQLIQNVFFLLFILFFFIKLLLKLNLYKVHLT